MSLDLLGRGLRPPPGRPRPGLPPPRERTGAGRGRRPGVRPALGAQRDGGRRAGREDEQVGGQRHLAPRAAQALRGPGAPDARPAGPLPLPDDRGRQGPRASQGSGGAARRLRPRDGACPARPAPTPPPWRASAGAWTTTSTRLAPSRWSSGRSGRPCRPRPGTGAGGGGAGLLRGRAWPIARHRARGAGPGRVRSLRRDAARGQAGLGGSRRHPGYPVQAMGFVVEDSPAGRGQAVPPGHVHRRACSLAAACG